MKYRYLTKVCKDGKRRLIETIKPIPPAAQKLLGLESVPQKRKAFEHDGIMITDRTKSPCGRFDLTPEESDKLYGNA